MLRCRKLIAVAGLIFVFGCPDAKTPTVEGSAVDQGVDAEAVDMGRVEMDAATPEEMSPEDMTPIPMEELPFSVDTASQEPDDSVEQANVFEIGQEIGGRILPSSEDGATYDQDIFSVVLQAGNIVELELNEKSNGFVAMLFVEDDAETVFRIFDSRRGDVRQFFVPEDGTYFFTVYDRKSDDGTRHDGGFYRFSTRLAEASPADVTVPSTTDLEHDGMLAVYSMTANLEGRLRIETFAFREPVESSLDTALVIWDVESQATVAYHDDIDFQADNVDSVVLTEVDSNREYWVIVDAYTMTSDNACQLVISEFDDAPSFATELQYDETATGTIAALEGEEFDSDYFTLVVEPGDVARVQVTGENGFEPTISVYLKTVFSSELLVAAEPVDNVVAVELPVGADRDAVSLFLVVDDIRNVPSEGMGQNIGGPDLTYSIDASKVVWTPTDATLPVSIPVVDLVLGSYEWIGVDGSAGHLIVLDASPAMSSNADPMASHYGPNGVASVEVPALLVGEAMTSYVLGIRDRTFRGGTEFSCQLDIFTEDVSGVTFNEVPDMEPNDGVIGSGAVDAGVVMTLPASVSGALSDNNNTPMDLRADWYQVSLPAGETLYAWTTAGGDDTIDDADTVIRILAADGTTVLASNDDRLGQAATFYSGLAYPNDDTMAESLYVALEPFCLPEDPPCSGNGDYTLSLFAKARP
jgi:hypothetical protein